MTSTIVFLIALLILSGFFSGSETAIISLNNAKVRSLKHQKLTGSQLLFSLKKNPHRLLITILIGNNLVNIGASVIAAALFTELFGSQGLGIATGVMTFFVLIFGEIVPKSFATKYATRIALFAAYPLYVLQIIFAPFIWFFDKIVKVLMHKFGASMASDRVSEEEIKALIDISAEEGAIEKREKELIKNVLRFNDIEVSEVMTPRVAVDAISANATLQEAIDFVIKKSHSRIPVYDKTIDNILGIVTVKDVLLLSEKYNVNKKLHNLELKKPIVVPESKKIDALFKEFQKERQHIAIVIDEYGGTTGIVTLEDLLEEIVGEIIDEFDVEESPIKKLAEDEIMACGTTRLEHINQHFNITIKGNENKPLSGFILEKLHRFPEEGEEIKLPQAILKVVKMHKNKILKVKIKKTKE